VSFYILVKNIFKKRESVNVWAGGRAGGLENKRRKKRKLHKACIISGYGGPSWIRSNYDAKMQGMAEEK
jgi:hypothetical protein